MTTPESKQFIMRNLTTSYQLDGSKHFWWTIYVCIVLNPLSFVSSTLPLLSFLLHFCQNIKSQTVFFLFVLLPFFCLPASLALCLTAACLNQQGFVWKWSVCSVFQGVSLTRLCTLSRLTTVCKALWVSQSSGPNKACWCLFDVLCCFSSEQYFHCGPGWILSLQAVDQPLLTYSTQGLLVKIGN